MMQKPDIVPDINIALQKPTESEKSNVTRLLITLRNKFERAKRHRFMDEQRWVKCYLNYRGQYGKEVQFTSTEKSRAFVKITKVKTQAAYAQIMEVVFGGSQFPITVDPVREPEKDMLPSVVHIDLNDPLANGPQQPQPNSVKQPDTGPGQSSHDQIWPVGYPGDGKDLAPGTKLSDILGADMANEYAQAKIKSGPSDGPGELELYPAEYSAKKMTKKILDQLDDSKAIVHTRHAVLEMCLLGTGCIKGPFAYDREIPRWTETGEYSPIIETVPRIEAVSILGIYPDPDAINSTECDWLFERHKLSKSQLRALKKRPLFIEEEIDNLIEESHNYIREWWENETDDANVVESIDRYEVLEYWGNIDADELKDHEIWDNIPPELKDQEEFQINCWFSGNHVLRLVLNPFTPKRIPYHLCPYELNPFNFFGIGVPENMEDSQTLMNGFTRMAVDNAVLSGNVVFEVNETMLTPGQSLDVFPGKVFRTQGGAPGQSIFATKFPNTSQENLAMFDKFRALADDATGIPSISHGQTGITGTNRTASGMSMILNGASQAIKSVVANIDDYMLQPLGDALFAFNMQFNPDPEIKGNLEVSACGTRSLMLKEVKSQRLMSFLQVVSNPALAPFAKFPTIIREIAETMDIDADQVCNNPQEAQFQAKVMGLAMGPGGPGAGTSQSPPGGSQPSPDQPPTPGAGGPPGANPQSPNGGGTIGSGAAPGPTDAGFTG